MGKISDIANGWANVLVKNEAAEQRAKQRAPICDTCEFASDEKVFDLENGEVVELKGYCKSCGCPFKSMLRSKNYKCKEDKW